MSSATPSPPSLFLRARKTQEGKGPVQVTQLVNGTSMTPSQPSSYSSRCGESDLIFNKQIRACVQMRVNLSKRKSTLYI